MTILFSMDAIQVPAVRCFRVCPPTILISVDATNPVNMPDPIWKRVGYDQLQPLRPTCSQNLAGWYICQIRLSASDSVMFFQRRPGSYCAKPARIRFGWLGQILAKGIWSGSKPVCKNHGARFWQDATGPLRVSRFQTWLHHSSTDGDDDDDVELHVLGCRLTY